MKKFLSFALPVLSMALSGANLLAQTLQDAPDPFGPAPSAVPAPPPERGPVLLEWVPPALAQLSSQAALKSSFTLDRDMLNVAAGLMQDQEGEVRQAVNKLDGVSVHTLRFGPEGVADPALVDAIREAYHLRGWKHLVTTNNTGGPVHNETTDVWLVLDGANLR